MSLNNINKNKLSLLYFFYGTETYLLDEAKSNVIKAAIKDEEREFNLSTYDLGEVPIDMAIDDAETLPFLGEKRVVIVEDPIFLTSQKDKSNIDHDLKRFETYIQNPSPDTIMIVLAPYEKLDERKKVVKALKQFSEVFHAEEMNEPKLLSWIDKRFQDHNVWANENAKRKILQLIGPKLLMLANEIDKIAIYVGENKEVDEETVLNLVARTLEQNIFALIDRVVHRNLKEALTLYYDLLEQKEEPIKILSLLIQQFRLIYQVKLLSKKGYGQNQIAGQVKVHPYRVKLASGQGRFFEESELLYIINELAEMDFKMKTGQMDKVLLLELFFISVNKEIKKEA